MTIPHSRPTLGEEEAQAALEAIRSGQLAEGERVAEFEAKMAAYLGRAEGVAVSSGTAALHLALLAIGTRPGDIVIVPSYNCAALAQAVAHAGARMRLCDVDPATGNPTAETISQAAEGARAIIVAHLFGAPAEMEKIAAIGPPVVEDLAQALGASLPSGKAGSFGHLAVCSFYATKLMTSGGEGGMILGDNTVALEQARDVRSYDERSDLAPRWNYKLTDLQAAIGLAQLSRYEAFIKRRREIAARYDDSLAESALELPADSTSGHVYHRYVVGLPNSWMKKHGAEAGERAIEEFEKMGVSARRPIYRPLHVLTGESGFPGTNAAWARHLSLPIFPTMTDDEADAVVQAAVSIFQGEGT